MSAKATVPQSPRFIIDPLFPTREIHLIAGASGAGKSTFACQLIDQLQKGDKIFGYVPNPTGQICYLAFDRSEEGMRRTFERTLGTTEIPFPFYSTVTSKEFSSAEDRTALGAIKKIRNLHPDIDVLFVDGIGMAFSGDSSRLYDVSRFVQDIVRFMLTNAMTIFALHHMGKQKKGNEYAQARARLHGSVAWAATAETCILVEPEAENDPENPNRIITICPRNAAEKVFTFAFDEDGRLVPAAGIIDRKSRYEHLKEAIRLYPSGTVIPKEEINAAGNNLDIPERTLKRYIADLMNDGVIDRVQRGHYRVLPQIVN